MLGLKLNHVSKRGPWSWTGRPQFLMTTQWLWRTHAYIVSCYWLYVCCPGFILSQKYIIWNNIFEKGMIFALNYIYNSYSSVLDLDLWGNISLNENTSPSSSNVCCNTAMSLLWYVLVITNDREIIYRCTKRSRYIAVNFHWRTHERNPISRP